MRQLKSGHNLWPQIAWNVICNRGGTRIIFWWGVLPEVWNPYPYLRIILPQKMADLTVFSKFSQIRTHFQGFFYLKNDWFYHFFFVVVASFVKWDPCLRIFGEKITYLGGTSPYVLTCENLSGFVINRKSLPKWHRQFALFFDDLLQYLSTNCVEGEIIPVFLMHHFNNAALLGEGEARRSRLRKFGCIFEAGRMLSLLFMYYCT